MGHWYRLTTLISRHSSLILAFEIGLVTPTPGVGVTKPIFSVPLFSTFPSLSKQTLAIEYRVHIWQVSPQLSCGDTCQIWMWFGESNRYFCKIENFANGEISERSFSNLDNARRIWSLHISMNSVLWSPNCRSKCLKWNSQFTNYTSMRLEWISDGTIRWLRHNVSHN